MKKLFNYLSKSGIEEKPTRGHYTDAPAEFFRELCGDPNFFNNAPNFTYYRARIVWNYSGATAESIKDFTEQEKKLKTYCKKYGYIFEVNYFYGDRVATIIKESDKEKARNFYYFRDAARAEFEQVAHELHEAGKANETNSAARLIMDKYGALYNEFLSNTETKTA